MMDEFTQKVSVCILVVYRCFRFSLASIILKLGDQFDAQARLDYNTSLVCTIAKLRLCRRIVYMTDVKVQLLQ